MRQPLSGTLLTLYLSLFLPWSYALAQGALTTTSPQPVTVPMRSCGNVTAIISVTLNGSGPYNFLLDTGTNTTLIGTDLFKQLGLHPEGSVELQSPAAVHKDIKSSVENVTVGALTGRDLEVVVLPKLPFGPECKTVRGVLGENFLKHLDLLIDYRHRQLTLDAGGSLAKSLDGEHLPVATAPEAGAIEYRPIVIVSLLEFDSHPVKVLLDSGAEDIMMFRQSVQTPGFNTGIQTVNGTVPCSQSTDRLVWGKTTSTGVSILTCKASVESLQNHVGNLPTSLFHQIFISHPGSYVIVNPVKRPTVSEGIAVDKSLL